MKSCLLKKSRAGLSLRGGCVIAVLASVLFAVAGGPLTGASGQSPAQGVVWDNFVHTQATGNTLQKTSGEWDGGANSQQQITALGGYVEFSVSANHRMQVGLSYDTTNAVDYTRLKYTFNFWGGDFDIREGWENMRLWGGGYTAGDVFRIAVEGGVVKYYKNGTLIYTSGVAPTGPLVLDTALSALGATVQNAVIYAPGEPPVTPSGGGSARAIILNGDANSGSTVGLPGAPYDAVGDFEVAFRMRDARVNYSLKQFVFMPRNHLKISIEPGGSNIAATTTTNGLGAAIPVSTRTYFRVRHIRATDRTTIEGWDADGSNYAISSHEGNDRGGPRNYTGTLSFGKSPDSWEAGWNVQAKIDWLRWRSGVGPEGVQPADSYTNYDLLRWEFENDGQDSAPHARHLVFPITPSFGDTPANGLIKPISRPGPDQTVKPGAVVTLDASQSASSEGSPTYSWQQVDGAPVSLSDPSAVHPTFTAPTPAGDRDCHVFRLTVTDAGGVSSNDVYIGVVKTWAGDVAAISDPKVRLVVGPQLILGSPLLEFPKFDQIQVNRGRANGEVFPNIAPHVIDGLVNAKQGLTVVTGVNTRFTQEIEMDPLVSTDYRGRLRIRDAVTQDMRDVEVASVQSDTQLTLKAPWGHPDTSNAPADTYYLDKAAAIMTYWNYYDTAYTLYITYYRTGNTRFLKLARKVADVWWSSENIGYGTAVEGNNKAAPRNLALAGLILRALDGKPEYWDFIERKLRTDVDRSILTRMDDTKMYDLREQGYTQLYAVMLSQVLPDTYLEYPNGTRNPPAVNPVNGVSKRDGYVRNVNDIAVDYFGRLQRLDGSWVWDVGENPVTHRDIMQPFMVGIYMEAAILQHQVTTDPTVKENLRNQIVKAVTHLKNIWRTDEATGYPGVKWRGHWYFYHGGTAANPTACVNGCPSSEPTDNTVTGVRHLNSEIQHAIGYAYLLTGDPAFREHGNDMLDADFDGTSPPDIFTGQADSVNKPKDYNMNYRGAGRYLVWRQGITGNQPPPPRPTNLKFTATSRQPGVTQGYLTWDDNSDDESGFVIESQTGGVWSQVGSVGPNVNTGNVTVNAGSGSSVSVPYRVKAVSVFGDSPYSDSVTVSAGQQPPASCAPTAGLIISEFRLRGPAGSKDEFVEFYNSSGSPITVCTADTSDGWTLAARSADGLSTRPVFTIMRDTVIPARAHYLVVNSSSGGYSLGDHPGGNNSTAAGDMTYRTDIEDNSGVALFKTANPSNFTTANRLDAAGFSGTAGATPDLYREGSGLPPVGSGNGEYTFVRKMIAGAPQDSGDNVSDFFFLATDAAVYGGVQAKLGAPGPENLASPIQRNDDIKASLIDPMQSSGDAPNSVRRQCAPMDSLVEECNPARSQNGTYSIRRRWTNMTGGLVTRLRFRVVDVATFPVANPATQADLRALSSGQVTGVTITGGGTLTVYGTALEGPPSQPLGGGWNSTLAAGVITPGEPLAPGASINLQFLLGVQNPGTYSFLVNVEALP